MPEGPSIVIIRDNLRSFIGKKVIHASGNSKKIEFNKLIGKEILDIKSWGKHLLICFDDLTVRVHFLMFGSYRINEFKNETSPRLSLEFKENESINFYACSVLQVYEPLDEVYEWSSDVLNSNWNEKKALQKIIKEPKRLVSDVLLDQNIFAGVGNIIKNEVLFRIKVNPKSEVGKLPPRKRSALVKEAVTYSFEFLNWKKEFTLRKHWLVYTKKICPRDHQPLSREYIGLTNRRTFFCNLCQILYI
jgi:endonuclease-8